MSHRCLATKAALSAAIACACLLSQPAHSATKNVDLDGNAANGAESQCDLNVLQTFPVKIETKITNKAAGDAYTFSWASAGPGGFTSSVTPGSTGGVGAKWTWTTNQTVYSYTGSTCDKDICFTKTDGPDSIPSYCSLACLADGTSATITKGGAAGTVVLSWAGGQGTYTIYRSTGKSGVVDTVNAIGTTDALTFTDTPPADTTVFYVVRGTDCNQRKTCVSNGDCSAPGDGTCVSRGPFGVPGRSLLTTDVTVSAASLTSSLVTFFSPPKEVFRVTSTANAGGFGETTTNSGTSPVTVTIPAYPPGCCPPNPAVPYQLRCGDDCVDYLNDPNNCGACANVCGEGTCCTNGSCESLCATGQIWCDGECVDPRNDDANCGSCGSACGEGTCCNDGECESLCAAGQAWCNGQCVDLQNDSGSCGACGNVCGDGTCCNGGACASVCAAGQTWSHGQCVDFQDDSGNCGSYGHVCGEGTCCSGGVCASLCAAGKTYCGGLCYDTQSDPSNCGACGNACDDQSVCSGGACVRCTGQGGARDSCDNRCVNLNTDPYNCGGCGISCNEGCPSGFKGVCSNGQSCACVQGTPAPQPPSNVPPPTPPACPNLNPSPGPVAGVCPNPSPSVPIGGVCPNPNPSTGPIGGVCPNPDPSSPTGGVCPNPDPSSPTAGVCGNPSPSYPVTGVCPDPGSPPPTEDATPNCVANETTQTIPPGGSSTICNQGGVLFKEVPTSVTVCGDGIPGVNGVCNNTSTKVTTGTFNRLVPDPTKTVGDAYVTPYAVHIASDTSHDGLLAPGESANLLIDVVNAGPANITQASATLAAPAVDLSDDGVFNPVGITVGTPSASYGTILGTPVSTNCVAAPPQPATNATVFPITVPTEHPGDTSHPFILSLTGTVNGAAFSMDVPIALGIADRCSPAANTRDFDGLDGLSNPMAELAPSGDPVPFPSNSFTAGNTRPLKLRVLCGDVNLTDATVDAPEIVGLSEATRGVLDIKALNLNSDDTNNPNDPFFRFNNSLSGGQWAYSMRTALIGTGRFTLTIRIAGRKEYVTGFVLE